MLDAATWNETAASAAAITDQLTARIAPEPPAVRTLAWASVAQALALAMVVRADAARLAPAVWVEPQMAWAIDALVEAGVPAVPTATTCARIVAGDDEVTEAVMRAALEATHAAATGPGELNEPEAHRQARAYTANRALTALRAIAREPQPTR